MPEMTLFYSNTGIWGHLLAVVSLVGMTLSTLVIFGRRNRLEKSFLALGMFVLTLLVGLLGTAYGFIEMHTPVSRLLFDPVEYDRMNSASTWIILHPVVFSLGLAIAQLSLLLFAVVRRSTTLLQEFLDKASQRHGTASHQ